MLHGHPTEHHHYNPHKREERKITHEEQRPKDKAFAAEGATDCVACCFMIPFLA
jgi:hypothetical protein